MRRAAFLSVIASMSITAAVPAKAWWEFARWGMTEQQVIAASKGRAVPCDGRCYRPAQPVANRLYVPDVSAAGVSGAASISFDQAGKADATTLKFPAGPANFGKLRDGLASVYGAPVATEGGAFPWVMWRDAGKKSTIKLWNLSTGPVVEYRPAATGL